nr:D479 [uncultured bacterium]
MKDMLGQLYEGSPLPADAMYELAVYGNPEPLCQLIEQGDAALWNDKNARDFIAKIIRDGGLRRRRGKSGETSPLKARRNDWIIRQLCFWKGFGLPIYGDGAGVNYKTACTVVSDYLKRTSGECGWAPIEADSIMNLWKNQPPDSGMRTLREAQGEALRNAAVTDTDLREKIKLEFGFDVDRVLGDIK